MLRNRLLPPQWGNRVALGVEPPEVIAGNRSALPEICGDAAWLVNPESEEELSSALRTLAADESRRDDLITRGRDYAAQFTWPRAVSETLEIYRELLQDSSSALMRSALRNR